MSLDRTEIAKLSPEQKEAFHREAEARRVPISYRQPDSGRPKDVMLLAKSTRMRALVQIVKDGGENNLHYHTHSDTTWIVLKGRARFYGPGDVLIGDYGPTEGILMPGGARYWFEKAGEETLELLQVVAQDQGTKGERVNVDGHKAWMEDSAQLKVYEEKV